MTGSIRRFNNIEEGSEFLSGLGDRKEDALCLFFGAEDNAGQSWCPDCVIACPVARRMCRQLRPELPLYEFSVGSLSQWKLSTTESPYRTNELVKVQRVPTLIRFRGGVPVGRLVEGDCADKAKLTELLSSP